jgi:hypothetical protein
MPSIETMKAIFSDWEPGDSVPVNRELLLSLLAVAKAAKEQGNTIATAEALAALEAAS